MYPKAYKHEKMGSTRTSINDGEDKMAEAIKKEMTIGEVVMKWPETAGTFMEWGLHCYGCAVARFENIEQGAQAHGIDPDKLVEALNDVIEKKE
jgi:hybrid cluster-associated redox disulfide protein